jgi:hypothetical protein
MNWRRENRAGSSLRHPSLAHAVNDAPALRVSAPIRWAVSAALDVFGAFLEASLCGGEMIKPGPVGIPSLRASSRESTGNSVKPEKSVCFIFGDSGFCRLFDEVISNAP